MSIYMGFYIFPNIRNHRSSFLNKAVHHYTVSFTNAKFTPMRVAVGVGITVIATPSTTLSENTLLLGDARGCHLFLMAPLRISASLRVWEPQGNCSQFPWGCIFEKVHAPVFFAQTQENELPAVPAQIPAAEMHRCEPSASVASFHSHTMCHIQSMFLMAQ